MSSFSVFSQPLRKIYQTKKAWTRNIVSLDCVLLLNDSSTFQNEIHKPIEENLHHGIGCACADIPA